MKGEALQEVLLRAHREGWAVPHFNVSNFVQLKGIAEAAKECASPVMIGTSEGEVNFVGYHMARNMVDAAQKEYAIPLFLNADHFHSFNTCQSAIDADYDAVLIDLSKETKAQNIAVTKEVVAYAKAKHVHVEAELGYLVTDSSKIYDEEVQIPPESLTDPEEGKEFVAATGIMRFAAAVGTLHGIAANTPILDFARIRAIRANVPEAVSLVLHGGSGVREEDFREAIACGINNIHISTHLRVAYTNALRNALASDADQTTPYKFYAPVVEAVKQEASKFIQLFGAAGKK